eukprot:360299-Chlamydomonas_euryale.AAC.4
MRPLGRACSCLATHHRSPLCPGGPLFGRRCLDPPTPATLPSAVMTSRLTALAAPFTSPLRSCRWSGNHERCPPLPLCPSLPPPAPHPHGRAGGLGTMKTMLESSLPRAYHETAMGVEPLSTTEEIVGQGVRCDQLPATVDDMKEQLSMQVLEPVEQWLSGYRIIKVCVYRGEGGGAVARWKVWWCRWSNRSIDITSSRSGGPEEQ